MRSFLYPNHHILSSQRKVSNMSRMKTFKTVTGTKLVDTGKAIKFSVNQVSGIPLEKETAHWFPVSQIEKMFFDSNSTGKDTLVVPEWILKEKGLV